MKQTPILILLLALAASFTKAQSERIEPFVDAVPYSISSNIKSNFYLTNKDASVVKAFFTSPGQYQPEEVVAVDDGYYHGFRLCYNSPDCAGRETPARWIQVVTINTRESIGWFEKSNPEFLMIPFLGIKDIVGRDGHSKSDFREVFKQYKHLACRLYQQSDEAVGENALSAVLHAYNTRIGLQTDQLLASGNDGVFPRPGSNQADYWDLWIQCLEEIDQAGYITLIEYSDDPSFWGPR